MIEIKCPNGHRLNVPEEYIGKQIRCAACQETFTVPAQSSAGSAPPQISVGATAADAPAPAIETPESTAGIATDAPSPSVTQRRRPIGAGISIEQYGKPLLFAGMCIVLLARGCDGLGIRNIGRLKARATQASVRFDRETQRQTEAEDDNDKKSKIREDRAKERSKLQTGRWRDLADDAADAIGNHALYAFIYQILFVFGSIILTAGLLTVGFTGTGPERTISLIMISIITFSIYIGGIAWIESVTSGFAGMLPGR